MASSALTSTRSDHPGEKEEKEGSSTAQGSDAGERGVPTGGRSGGGDSSKVCASPFDRLPDELLSAVLALLANDQKVKLDDVCLSKRFWRLACPLWAATIRPEAKTQPRLLQRLSTRPDLAPCVRTLHAYFLDGPILVSDCGAIQSFSNLTTLSLTSIYYGNYGDAPLPRFFSSTLRSLTKLKHLSLLFDAPCAFEDTTFSIGAALPSLQSLELYMEEENRVTSQIFSTPCPNLIALSLFLSVTDERTCSLIPWTSLDELDLTFLPPYEPEEADPTCTERSMTALLKSFQQAATSSTSPLILQQFTCENELFGREGSDVDQQLPTLFTLLREAQVKELNLSLESEIVVSKELQALPSVTSLILLGMPVDLSNQPAVESFHNLLRLFPYLKHLSIATIAFSSSSSSASPPALTSAQLPAYPPLANLLSFLHRQGVTRFTYSDARNRAKYRWRLDEGEEGFEVEVFSQR